jgi:hypothetical protein
MTSDDKDSSFHTQAVNGFQSCILGFNPSVVHVDLWWRKWQWVKSFSRISDFSSLMNIPPMLHTHLPSGVFAIWPSEAAVHLLNCWQLHYVNSYVFFWYQFLKTIWKKLKSTVLTQLILSRYSAAVFLLTSVHSLQKQAFG